MPMSPRLLRPLASSGFDPRKLSGLGLWVDFSDTASVTLDENSKISAVLDKSGNARNGSQTTSALRLGVSTLNGRQCADNGSATNSLGINWAAGSNVSNWRHFFMAATWDGGGSTFGVNSFFSSTAASGTASGGVVITQNGTNAFQANAFFGGTSGVLSEWRYNNGTYTNSDRTFAYFAGETFVFDHKALANMGVNGWQIGTDRVFANRGWRGRVGEVISYERSLSDSEAASVNLYLMKKWGVA